MFIPELKSTEIKRNSREERIKLHSVAAIDDGLMLRIKRSNQEGITDIAVIYHWPIVSVIYDP